MLRQGFDDPHIVNAESLETIRDLLAHIVRHDRARTPFDLEQHGRPGLQHELNERNEPLGAGGRLQIIRREHRSATQLRRRHIPGHVAEQGHQVAMRVAPKLVADVALALIGLDKIPEGVFGRPPAMRVRAIVIGRGHKIVNAALNQEGRVWIPLAEHRQFPDRSLHADLHIGP
jgi:hypothetical protein